MHKPVLDGIFLKFETALQEELELKSGAKIHLASWLNKEENATVIGTVHSIGDTAKLKYITGGVEYDVKDGDEVACSYHVVAAHELDKDGTTTYHNCYWMGKEKLWLASVENIMAVNKGGWVGVNDWVVMKEVFEPEVTSSFIIIPESMKIPVLMKGRGEYVSGDLDCAKGQHLFFDEQYRSVYQIGSEKFIFLKRDRIEGVFKNVA